MGFGSFVAKANQAAIDNIFTVKS